MPALAIEIDSTFSVAWGDADGDSDLDLAVGSRSGSPNRVYLNDGVGRFTRAWDVGPEVEPTRSAQLHDLDGDGSLDVLVTNRGTARFSP